MEFKTEFFGSYTETSLLYFHHNNKVWLTKIVPCRIFPPEMESFRQSELRPELTTVGHLLKLIHIAILLLKSTSSRYSSRWIMANALPYLSRLPVISWLHRRLAHRLPCLSETKIQYWINAFIDCYVNQLYVS